MFGMRDEEVKRIKATFAPGTKIELFEMRGEPQMSQGLIGVVRLVDDIGQVHVNWENGSRLALHIYDDSFRIVE